MALLLGACMRNVIVQMSPPLGPDLLFELQDLGRVEVLGEPLALPLPQLHRHS